MQSSDLPFSMPCQVMSKWQAREAALDPLAVPLASRSPFWRLHALPV